MAAVMDRGSGGGRREGHHVRFCGSTEPRRADRGRQFSCRTQMKSIFVPATAAPDPGADVARQTAMTLARVDERLRAERSSLADAVAVTVYLRSASAFAAMNDAYRQAWTSAPPTRTTVVTAPVTPDAIVEMSAVAVPSGADRRVVHPSSWMMSPNPYSYGIRSGETLWLSGLLARRGRD